MHKTLLPYDKAPQLAKTDVAYATADPLLAPFYKYKPDPANFQKIILDKSRETFPRAALVKVLQEQYGHFPENVFVNRQINALANDTTFTVVTAHQPALLLGPLYFIYKAITTINLAETIQATVGTRQHIVPVFVLGSEDHDLEELNHIQLFNRQLRWEPGIAGPVGPIPSGTLQPVLQELNEILGDSDNARHIYNRIEKAYTRQANFAAATQALLHDLFGRYGLVVLNMNHPDLKRHFIPVMRDELLHHTAFQLVGDTIAQLNQLGFKAQAAPRPINLFYLQEGSRERIVQEDNHYAVLNTEIRFTQEEILAELNRHPERFSPNVVLRPLYQETILPNLAYVGGGGELAYWLERKSLFEHYGINFPLLVRRNSVLWLDRDAEKRLIKTGLSAHQLFEDTDLLIRRFVEDNAAMEVSLAGEIADMRAIFERIAEKAVAADPTLEKAVLADAARQTSLLEQWQARLVKAEKQKHEVVINQIRNLKDKFFPAGGLQERHDNFLPYYLRYGEYYLDALKENLQPLDHQFIILQER